MHFREMDIEMKDIITMYKNKKYDEFLKKTENIFDNTNDYTQNELTILDNFISDEIYKDDKKYFFKIFNFPVKEEEEFSDEDFYYSVYNDNIDYVIDSCMYNCAMKAAIHCDKLFGGNFVELIGCQRFVSKELMIKFLNKHMYNFEVSRLDDMDYYIYEAVDMIDEYDEDILAYFYPCDHFDTLYGHMLLLSNKNDKRFLEYIIRNESDDTILECIFHSDNDRGEPNDKEKLLKKIFEIRPSMANHDSVKPLSARPYARKLN